MNQVAKIFTTPAPDFFYHINYSLKVTIFSFSFYSIYVSSVWFLPLMRT